MVRLHVASLLCCVTFGPLPALVAQWTCVVLAPSGASTSHANAAAGSRQAGWAVVGGSYHAALWSATSASFVDLNPTGWSVSQVLGMSPSAQVGYTYNGAPRAALWTGSSGSWVSLHPTTASSSAVYATSGSLHVGRVAAPGGDHAAAWSGASAASWVDLNPPGAASTYAFAVSGTQIVGYSNSGSPAHAHAILWTGSASSHVDLTPVNATHARGFGVGGGQQVGEATISGQLHAALWHGTAASFIDLNPSPSVTSHANAVFGGKQVGYVIVSGVGSRATLWNGTASPIVDLHAFVPSPYTGSIATAIWNDGSTIYVAGYGSRGSFDDALLWTTPATPSTPAANTSIGSGCNGLTLGANSRPVLGSNWSLTVSGIPATASFGASFFGFSDPGLLDLANLGMPTCQLRASLDWVAGPWTPSGASQGYSFPIPAGSPSLLGLQFFTQAIVFTAPPVNAFGAITSNGMMGTLGDL
ncbi:MAG: hypothetical protein U1F36_02260 [Planctomycetota bacterium]